MKQPNRTPKNAALLALVVGVLVALGYWLLPHSSAPQWDIESALELPNEALAVRIDDKLFGARIVEPDGIGADIDTPLDTEAMVSKLAGLTKNVTTQAEPSDAELRDFYARNKAQYRLPSKLWVTLIDFTTAKHGGDVFAAAQRALVGSGTPEGDMRTQYTGILSTALEAQYGRGFTDGLLTLIATKTDLPCWAGPISSNQGTHLVCVEDIIWGEYSPLEDIKRQVINDWRFAVTESL